MMATDDITECMFTVGSIVSCLTCFDVKIEGEVIAFDYTKRLLVLSESLPFIWSSIYSCSHSLESNSSDGNKNLNDVNWINLEFVKDIQIKKEVKREDVVNTQLPQINTQKVNII